MNTYIYKGDIYKYDNFDLQMGDLFEVLSNNLIVNLTTNIAQDHVSDEDIDMLITNSVEYTTGEINKAIEAETRNYLHDLQIVDINEFIQINYAKIKKLINYGMLLRNSDTNIRDYNIGNSNYSHHLIQPWSIWQDYDLNPWDADIIKRVLRTKHEGNLNEQQTRKLDYEKIIHICQERLRQLR